MFLIDRDVDEVKTIKHRARDTSGLASELAGDQYIHDLLWTFDGAEAGR